VRSDIDVRQRCIDDDGAADSAEFTINRVVEVDDEGVCADFPLPR
jgi:hypothetical protein